MGSQSIRGSRDEMPASCKPPPADPSDDSSHNKTRRPKRRSRSPAASPRSRVTPTPHSRQGSIDQELNRTREFPALALYRAKRKFFSSAPPAISAVLARHRSRDAPRRQARNGDLNRTLCIGRSCPCSSAMSARSRSSSNSPTPVPENAGEWIENPRLTRARHYGCWRNLAPSNGAR
jgi:hypothetical protein